MISDGVNLGKQGVPSAVGPVAQSAGLLRWRMNPIEFVVLVMTVGVLIGLLLPSGDRDYSHRFPPAGPNPEDGFADVAGEYYQGGLGRIWCLRILPDGRYSFRWSGCCGVYHRESGSASRVGEDLTLSPVEPIVPRIDRTFRPIRWGRRSYLIPPAKLGDFGKAVARGSEPRSEIPGNFYLMGHDQTVDGLPELPEPWANELRKGVAIREPAADPVP